MNKMFLVKPSPSLIDVGFEAWALINRLILQCKSLYIYSVLIINLKKKCSNVTESVRIQIAWNPLKQ